MSHLLVQRARIERAASSVSGVQKVRRGAVLRVREVMRRERWSWGPKDAFFEGRVVVGECPGMVEVLRPQILSLRGKGRRWRSEGAFVKRLKVPRCQGRRGCREVTGEQVLSGQVLRAAVQRRKSRIWVWGDVERGEVLRRERPMEPVDRWREKALLGRGAPACKTGGIVVCRRGQLRDGEWVPRAK